MFFVCMALCPVRLFNWAIAAGNNHHHWYLAGIIISVLRGIRGQLQSGHKESAPTLFWYQVPPSVTPPGGLLGAARISQRAAPFFAEHLLQRCTET